MRDPNILALAQRAVAAAGGIAIAAASMGISRPYLSRYLNDDLDNPKPVEAVIAKRYGIRLCLHSGMEIEAEACRRKALAPKPFGGSARLAHWNTCQRCPNKPEGEVACASN